MVGVLWGVFEPDGLRGASIALGELSKPVSAGVEQMKHETPAIEILRYLRCGPGRSYHSLSLSSEVRPELNASSPIFLSHNNCEVIPESIAM